MISVNDTPDFTAEAAASKKLYRRSSGFVRVGFPVSSFNSESTVSSSLKFIGMAFFS
jgi:hypothetical protein